MYALRRFVLWTRALRPAECVRFLRILTLLVFPGHYSGQKVYSQCWWWHSHTPLVSRHRALLWKTTCFHSPWDLNSKPQPLDCILFGNDFKCILPVYNLVTGPCSSKLWENISLKLQASKGWFGIKDTLRPLKVINFYNISEKPHLGCPSWLAGTLGSVRWHPQRYRPWPESSILPEAGVLRSPWVRCSCTGLWALSSGQSHQGFHEPPPRIPSQRCHHRKTAQTRTKPESEGRERTPRDRRQEAVAGLDKTHINTNHFIKCLYHFLWNFYLIILHVKWDFDKVNVLFRLEYIWHIIVRLLNLTWTRCLLIKIQKVKKYLKLKSKV